jgi:hypothetical protein
MKYGLLVLFIALSAFASSQDITPSNTYVRTCLSDIECSSINSSSFLFYDEPKGKFYIKIDFNRFKSGIDSVDFWLEDLNDTYFYFKASMPRENLPKMSNYNRKSFRLSGAAFMNGLWKPMNMDITVFRAEGDMMSNTINADNYNAYKVNFNFQLVPKDFNINKKPQRLKNTIFIGVGSGVINTVKPGMEGQLGEAYDYAD